MFCEGLRTTAKMDTWGLGGKLMENIRKHALFDDFERKTLKKLLFFAILHAKLSKNIKNMQELTKLVGNH